MFELSNLWVLFGAALVHYVIGALWYSPKLFGTQWMEQRGLKKEEVDNCGIGVYLGAFISSLLVAFALSTLFYLTGSRGFFDASAVSFLVWLGFTFTNHLSGYLWENTPLSLLLVNTSYGLVATQVTGFFLSLF